LMGRKKKTDPFRKKKIINRITNEETEKKRTRCSSLETVGG